MKNTFALIPARAGSKRCPHKNTRPFFGKSLLERTIELALESYLFDCVIVSSEDIPTLDLARRHKAIALHRPPKLSTDGAETEEVIDHAIRMNPRYSTLCLLYCQAGAFITPAILQDSHSRFNFKSPLVSWVVETNKDAGQFYWINAKRFMKEWADGKELLAQNIEQWPIHAGDVQDINTEGDWKVAEMKYRRMHA